MATWASGGVDATLSTMITAMTIKGLIPVLTLVRHFIRSSYFFAVVTVGFALSQDLSPNKLLLKRHLSPNIKVPFKQGR